MVADPPELALVGTSWQLLAFPGIPGQAGPLKRGERCPAPRDDLRVNESEINSDESSADLSNHTTSFAYASGICHLIYIQLPGNSANYISGGLALVMCRGVEMGAKDIKTGPEQLCAAPVEKPRNPSLFSHLKLEILLIMLACTYILSLLVGRAVSAVINNDLRDTSIFGRRCIVRPGGSDTIDDAPAILEAFNDCGQNGNVIFLNTTYYVNSVMNTSGLTNCQVDIYGTLLVCCPLMAPLT